TLNQPQMIASKLVIDEDAIESNGRYSNLQSGTIEKTSSDGTGGTLTLHFTDSEEPYKGTFTVVGDYMEFHLYRGDAANWAKKVTELPDWMGYLKARLYRPGRPALPPAPYCDRLYSVRNNFKERDRKRVEVRRSSPEETFQSYRKAWIHGDWK